MLNKISRTLESLKGHLVTDFCSEANLDMPLKIEGNGGTQFSGGETARLCLARALCGRNRYVPIGI